MSTRKEEEACAAVLRVAALATATENALSDARGPLQAAGRHDLLRQSEKVAEFHRLLCRRIASILRQLAEDE